MVPRWAVATMLLFGGMFVIAYGVPALERRGVPGIVLAGPILLVLAAVSLSAVLRGFPPRGRRRTLTRFAAERGLRMRIRPRLPGSMSRLPTFADPRLLARDTWHLIVVPDDPAILSFDRRVSSEDPYEPPMWLASAACTVPLDAPAVIVEPRPALTADPFGPLIVWTSESEGFARRFRIRTDDRLFATTFLDQRMLAWMLDQDPGWTFEVGGRWAMVSRPILPEGLSAAAAIEILRGFRATIPSVAVATHPAPPSPI